ncbi:DUF4389 domain-containing protein [Cryobacterium sp. 10I1]|uniref:DUF4389 domain-containing protein n=1 Tax=unclassified Cryobacterium TaxID=2649013 RepID=UPI001F5461DF|nr:MULTISPECIES: DUF4389 domain-containing protein [unclassified Cryobacterium]MEB0002667.1 DUF4389 domain-containing protein [Cryobacterium sp. RTC2.1]MEB0201063.1 DUF4389 domain-containing protein [Cryobacterium sp. 5I3]MEB0286673.1 DUF4389 domain-containing protein [Cryobacterium sp. 10S3]MEB0305141.1 DUF4389 domain-containing protein [Cryobacterium sp. 10I1]WPX15637.1 DUF4389 domain-containing protein [Cryobacterium sp. 10S3]
MKAGYVVMVIVGTLLAVSGIGLLAGGVAVATVAAQQGRDGFLTTPSGSFSVASYAITSPNLTTESDSGTGTSTQAGSGGMPSGLATVMLEATSVRGTGVFIGIAPRAEVERYLASVAHSELTSVNSTPFRTEYREVPGSRRPARPGSQTWWTVAASGPGTQRLVWPVVSGDWAVVVMNADATQGVDVEARAGVRSGLFVPAAVALLLGGGLLLVAGVLLVVFGALGLGRRDSAQGPDDHDGAVGTTGTAGAMGTAGAIGAVAATGPPGPVYPARLEGTLQPDVSRGLWLVKWILIFPHVVVLFFLWFATFVTTIVAGFAILFTGRYPLALFTFNVGVLRWSWRVAFYAYSALGTDRYPPFTLAPADYPADLDIDYPERLSRGLVLVKWWLLAIPQILIVSALTSTPTARYTIGDTTYSTTTGVSLLGLLVLIAGLMLLFTGHYRQSLFDFILGIDRWVFRVVVYTGLFRDDYPPFRLDQGGTETGGTGPGGIDEAARVKTT